MFFRATRVLAHSASMYEGDTFKAAIDKIKVRYRVKRVVIVADSGLLVLRTKYEYYPNRI